MKNKDQVLKKYDDLVTEIEKTEQKIQASKGAKQSLNQASQDLITAMSELSGALLGQFQKQANFEEITQNLEIIAELEEDVSTALQKWQKRKLKGLADNYTTKAKMATDQSRAIRREAEKKKMEIKIDVEALSDYILGGEKEEQSKARVEREEVKNDYLTEKIALETARLHDIQRQIHEVEKQILEKKNARNQVLNWKNVAQRLMARRNKMN